MAPQTTESRQPASHEWRRHSLVRVRRPAWSGHASDETSGRGKQPEPAEAEARQLHTTHDDIAW